MPEVSWLLIISRQSFPANYKETSLNIFFILQLKYIEDGGSPDSEESSDLVRCLEEVAVQHGFVGR